VSLAILGWILTLKRDFYGMPTPIATSTSFLTKKVDYEALLNEIIVRAKKKGATQVEAAITHNLGYTVTVREKAVETIEHHRNKALGVTVYFDQRKGSATSVDLNQTAIENLIASACHMARFTAIDPFSGLADPALLAKPTYPSLDLYHPWSLTPQQAIELGIECETKALALDSRILHSEGVTITTDESFYFYANSHDFLGSYPTSRHSISCSLVAKDKGGMQRDGDYTVARVPSALSSISQLATHAAQATVKRLNARRLATCQVPVLFRSEVARSLISHFLGAISGGNLYRNASFLVNQLGKPIFAPSITLHEQPHLQQGLGSTPFDSEGVRTQNRTLVADGVLQGYLLSSYSARKLGLQSTGNAGGAHNILVETSDLDLTNLIKKMHRGLLVTELLGQGTNLVTGDYSRGAAGFWVENGQIQYPVEEITIAGNLKEIYPHIVAVGNDIDPRSSILTGSILVENMTVAGA
jgi:PmbA protein